MKADKNLTGFEYMIYHHNRFFAISISIIAIIFGWQFTLPIVLVGWVIYFIMYYIRDLFYKNGLGRYYVYGALFYIGMFLALWIKPIKIVFNPSLLYSLSGLDYLIHNVLSFINLSACGWGISFGVIIYLLMVELDRKKIKTQDLQSLRLSEKDLYNYSADLMYICFLIIIAVLFVAWSWVLAVLVAIYATICLYISRSVVKWLDLVMLVLMVLASYKSDVALLLSFPANVYAHYSDSVFLTLKNELIRFVPLIPVGVLWGAIPLFIVRVVTNFNLTAKSISIINEVYNDKHGHKAKGDMLLGYHHVTGHNIELTDKENNQHTLILGTTGAGKTTAILNYVEHSAKNGYPCIFLDGKGSSDLPLKIKQIAEKYNRTFKYFTLKPHVVPAELKVNLASYNPFGSGTFTEWKNRIMALFAQAEGRGQQHYALMEEKFINTIVNILQKAGGNLNLKQLLTFIREPELLQHLAVKIGDNVLIQQADQLKEQGDIAKDVVALLELFIQSSYGELFDPQSITNVIDLKKSIENGDIVLFMFDSSAYKSDTEKVARMVINDINSSFSELSYPITTYAIFDEFASYASSNLNDTISLHRSNGMHAVVGTQSVTTVGLKNVDTQRIAEELLACCNTYLLMATNHDEDIERMAKIFGTRRTFEITTQLDVKQGGGTGLGSAKTVDEFLVHPQKVRDLRPSEAFIYRKALGLKPFKMRVNQVELRDS